MAVLKCSICGGELEVNEELSIGVCKFCDSTIVIPKNIDKRENLYNRAEFLRQSNEFDKAIAAYEDILREDNEDAGAHWGAVLSKYGIEYVCDPRTGQYIPTCHRTQAASILSDPDYLAALEYSDIEARHVIEMEAKRISEIQARILEISQKEPPYDIFICYKESDEAGNRTEDSVLAQDLYDQLTKKDYKVFFARKTLESKLGKEYEPIIYAALSSAKVMIVLGTKAENFSAVWVRNEWSRFLKMSESAQKTIIPAYRGISPYELPVELSGLQAQDMAKLGFMQDLLDGVERYLRNETAEKSRQKAGAEPSYGTSHVERLIKNGDTCLKLDDIAAAQEAYSTAAKEYPEDFRGWWGLVVCQTQNFTTIVSDQSTLNRWFGHVRQLATQEEYAEREKIYLEYTKKIAAYDAAEDVKAVEKKISVYNDQIKELDKQLTSEREADAKEIQDLESAMERNDRELDAIKAKIAEDQRRGKRLVEGGKVFGLILVVGIFFAVIGAFFDISGIALFGGTTMGFAVIGLFVYLLLNSKDEDMSIPAQNAALAKAMDAKENYEKEHDEIALKHQTRIDRQENAIAAIQANIAKCQDYLALGADKMAEYWYAQRCSVFGVQRPVESHVVECRQAVFAIPENAQEEEHSIACPPLRQLYCHTEEGI